MTMNDSLGHKNKLDKKGKITLIISLAFITHLRLVCKYNIAFKYFLVKHFLA